jgi:hypothetical protein
LLVLIAATGWTVPLLVVYAAGSVVTALLRVGKVHRHLSAVAS